MFAMFCPVMITSPRVVLLSRGFLLLRRENMIDVSSVTDVSRPLHCT